MKKNIQKIGLEKTVPEKYKYYMDYVNTERMFPFVVDGLLPVQRRVLLGLHTFARESYVKTKSVSGNIMAAWHPHADKSIEDVLAWAVYNEFADPSGQWGTRIGMYNIPYSSPRYTKIRALKEITDTAFKYIKSVPWVESEVQDEPLYIPTMLPFCLMGKYEKINMGLGFKAEIPVFQKKDLFKRLQFLLGMIDKEPIIKPIIEGCKIISKNKECKQLLNTGEAKLEIEGLYEEIPDEKVILVKGWGRRSSFDVLEKRINKFKNYNLLEKGEIGRIDCTKAETCIRFEVLRKKGSDDVYDKMVESIKDSLKSNVTYKMYAVTEDKNFKLTSVDEMLLTCYKYYVKAFIQHQKNLILSLNQRIDEANIIVKIRPLIKDCIAKEMYDVESIKYLSKNSNIKEEDIKSVIEKYNIKKLMNVKLDIEEYKKSILVCEAKIKNSEKEVMSEYEALFNK